MQRLTTIYLCASGLRPMLAFLFGAAAGPLRAIAFRLCRLRSVSPLSTYAPPPPRPELAILFGAAAGPSRAIASSLCRRLCRLCSVTPLSTYAPPPPRPTLALLFGAAAGPSRAIASNLCRLCSVTPLSTYAPLARGLDAGSPLRNDGFGHTSTTAADCVMSSPLCFRSRQMVGGQSHHLRRRLHYLLHEVGGIGSNVATLRWS